MSTTRPLGLFHTPPSAWRLTPSDVLEHWQSKDMLVLPDDPANVRAVVLGESGSGKTVLLRRILLTAAMRSWRTIFLDAKGDLRDAEKISQRSGAPVVRRYRLEPVPLPTLAHEPDAGAGLADLLMSVRPLTGTDADFYRTEIERFVRAVLTSETAGREPLPRTLPDIRERLESVESWSPDQAEDFRDARVRARVLQGWDASWKRLDGYLDPAGWAWHDRQSIVHPIQPSDPRQRALARVIIDQAFTFLRWRQETDDRSPVLLVIDELAQISDTGDRLADLAARLLELARSTGVGVVFAAQSSYTLANDEDEARRILTAGGVVFAGRQRAGRLVEEIAGEVPRPEMTVDAQGRPLRGRTNDEARLPARDLAGASVGEFWAIGNGSVQSVRLANGR